MKRVAYSLIICFVFSIIFSFSYPIEANDLSQKQGSDYNENTLKTLSFKEQLSIVNPTCEEVDRLTTEEMADLALKYPFLGDFWIMDSTAAYIQYLSRTSYLFEQLFSRDDVYKVLLKKLDELYIDTSILYSKSGDSFEKSGYIKWIFLNKFFIYNFDKLNDNEKGILLEILDKKKQPGFMMFETEKNLDAEIKYKSIVNGTKSDGFNSSGQVISYNGGYYYPGVYIKYGTSASCYQFSYGDLTQTEINCILNYMNTYHSNWNKITDPTRKFNCHAYAWINSSSSNIYWLPSPNSFKNASSYFTYIGDCCSTNTGDHIVVYDNYGVSQHSLIVTSGGNPQYTNVYTRSKCGLAGIYDVEITDIVMAYGSGYEVYR